MGKIRVAHVLEAVWSGGVEQRRLILAEQLPKDRFEQILICTRASGKLPDLFERAGVPVHIMGDFRFPLDPRPLTQCWRVLRQFRPHIVHGAVYEGVEAAAIAGRIAQVPVIIGEETSDPRSRRFKGHLLYRLLLALTDRMVAVSPMVCDYLVNDIHYPTKRARTIQNGIGDPGPADPELVRNIRQLCGAGENDILIGTVGRLFNHHKRISDLLHALALARRTVSELRLVVVGDGVDREMLKAFAVTVGVADIVSFVGYQPETRPYFEAMDIYVHPAAEEAFGLVIVEAMLAARPVIACAVGGIPAVVEDGTTALLVPREQPVALADTIVMLARDRERRDELGLKGRRRAKALFTMERYSAEVANFYEQSLKEIRPSLAARLEGHDGLA